METNRGTMGTINGQIKVIVITTTDRGDEIGKQRLIILPQSTGT